MVATSQASLTFSPQWSGGEDWAVELEIIRSAVTHLGLKDVAFELDLSGSLLSDSLNERDRKGWRAKWSRVVKRMLFARRDDVSKKLLRALVELECAYGYDVIDASPSLSDADIVAAYRRGDLGWKAGQR